MEEINYFDKGTKIHYDAYPVYGNMITVEFSNYSFAYYDLKFVTITLNKYRNNEIVQRAQTSLQALINFFDKGQTYHETEWPRGDIDKWTFTEKGNFVTIEAKCHTGGKFKIRKSALAEITEKARKTQESIWNANAELRAESEKRQKEREELYTLSN